MKLKALITTLAALTLALAAFTGAAFANGNGKDDARGQEK